MIYIAAPFFTDAQLLFVNQIESVLEANDWEFFSPRKEGVLKDMSPVERFEKMHEIYESNVKNVRNSDIILAVIDDRDPGTIFEIGFAAALMKPIVTLTNHDYQVNVMIRNCTKAHLKGLMDLPRVIDYINVGAEVPSYLCNNNEDVT